jgi:hypothetical protein
MSGTGVACSLALHLLAALLVFGIAGSTRPPPQFAEPIPVDLVDLGEKTVPATGLAAHRQPAQKLAVTLPPQPSETKPTAPSPPEKSVPAASRPEKPVPAPARHQAHVAPEPRKAPPPADDFSAMLNAMNKLRQPAPAQTGPQPQSGPAQPGLTAENDRGALGRRGTLRVRDFIRAQIERHWEFDVAALATSNIVISLHLVLRTDGGVSSAEIVDDPRYSSNPYYRPIADSVRRAALVASPLQLPPGIDADAFTDLTLSFNPKDVLR